jgi:hypothetical protein
VKVWYNDDLVIEELIEQFDNFIDSSDYLDDFQIENIIKQEIEDVSN